MKEVKIMKKIIEINNKMPVLWDGKVKFVSVCQFWVLALCSSFGSVSGPFTSPRLFFHLGKEKKRERKEKNKPPADFKPIE